ncbi:hypothetical protein ACQRWG_06110 [Stenotrophomonas maltophilia]|uniref:hypothetical protein n=1 Tax=Stenotrophomonas TaxID=40323 RepID=UPI002E79D40C|nr:hypothetical protein [Stenotrophomonas sepilia]
MSDPYGTPNESEQHQNLDVSRCIEVEDEVDISGIDFFEDNLKELIKFTATNYKDREIIRLALLGLVSLTENYFRIILSDTLRSCPESHSLCSKFDVNFASARYYSPRSIARSLVDSSVFSNSTTIASETKKLTGIDVNDSESVKNALSEFHKVCILRHAAVHSFGRLGGKNVMELGLRQASGVMVSPSYDAFDEICGICQNLVRAYNSFMWRAIVSRLKSKGLLKFDNSSIDQDFFTTLQNVFWTRTKIASDAGVLYGEISAQATG